MYEEEPSILDLIFGLVFSSGFTFGLLTLIVLFGSVVITPGKRAKIIERLGRPLEAARMPGLSFKIPLIDRVVGEINLQQREIKASVAVKTKDNAFVELPVAVQYRSSSNPAGAVRAYYELEDPARQITSYVLNDVRQTASRLVLDELYNNRDEIKQQVKDSLETQFERYGYSIDDVLVDEPQLSDEVQKAFNDVISSVRRKDAAANIAEAERIKVVGVATAEKEAKKLAGEGIADMRNAIAKGLKESMENLTGVMSPQEALALVMDTNRLDTLGTAAAHGNMVLVDMNGGGDLPKLMAAVKAAQHET